MHTFKKGDRVRLINADKSDKEARNYALEDGLQLGYYYTVADVTNENWLLLEGHRMHHPGEKFAHAPVRLKWTELAPQERHRLLGELIDAMIYSAEATAEVMALVEKFRASGLIKSIILPNN